MKDPAKSQSCCNQLPNLFELMKLCCLLALSLAIPSATSHAEVPQNPASLFHLDNGIVVERLSAHHQAAKIGMQPGDLLIRWSRSDRNGEISSPFDLGYLRYAEAPQGAFTIEGTSHGKVQRWRLGSDVWGIWGRPNFHGALLVKYQECEALPKSTEPDLANQCWAVTATMAQRFSEPWLPGWIWSQAAQQFANYAEWDLSDTAYRQALQSAVDADPMVKGQILRQWANALAGRQDLGNAVSRYEEALAQWKTVDGAVVATATPLVEIGAEAFNLGDYEKAEKCWQEALAIVQRSAPRSLEAALAYGNLGLLYQREGYLAKALEFHRRALTVEQKYLPGTLYIPQQLTNMGILARDRGDLIAAESYHRAALAAIKQVGLMNPGAANILDDLSESALDRDDLAGAERYQHRALAIRQEVVPDSLDVASSLFSLASIAERRGNLDHAEELYRKALIVQQRLAAWSTPTADTVAGLGSVLQRQGHSDEAEQYFRKAISIVDKAAPASIKHGEFLASLAAVLRQKGQLEESAQLYREALEHIESKIAQLGPLGENYARYRSRHFEYYREYADLLVEQRRPELAFQVLEGSHARTLYEMLSASRIAIRQGLSPELLANERDMRQLIAAKSQDRTQLLAREHRDEELNDLDHQISSLHDRYRELEAQIRVNNPAYAALTQPQPLSIKEIQQLLDPDSLLIEYSLGEAHSHVWVVSENSLEVYSLPPRVEIERTARQVYNLLTARNHEGSMTEAALAAHWAKADAEYSKAATDLSRKVLGPIAAVLGSKRLLIVSDGGLQYIPFAALPALDGAQAGRPMLADHEIVNLPSASVLAELRRQARTRKEALKTVAVLADPVFNEQDRRVLKNAADSNLNELHTAGGEQGASAKRLTRSAADVSGRRISRNGKFYLERLLYTRKEAEAILAVTPAGKGMKALDFQASRAMALNPALAQYRIVHFATHGLLDSRHPELSGLVFSLVNKQGKPQDGFLELQDIYNLTLPVELVVLSGCKTGLGEEINGEGIVGLTRGFMYAGATRVVASLWGVGDWATAELMEHFYRAMEQEHMRPAAALRAAQIQMWKQASWKPPYYWAAFQIQGEWK